jgi:hypothetical protein
VPNWRACRFGDGSRLRGIDPSSGAVYPMASRQSHGRLCGPGVSAPADQREEAGDHHRANGDFLGMSLGAQLDPFASASLLLDNQGPDSEGVHGSFLLQRAEPLAAPGTAA